MSGSYDRPPGPGRGPAPPPPPVAPRSRAQEGYYTGAPSPTQPGGRTGTPATAASDQAPRPGTGSADAYDAGTYAPRTGSYAGTTSPHDGQPPGETGSGSDARFDPELKAEGRTSGAQRRQGKAGGAVVPAGSVTSRSLTLVIAIMCFLACLTAGGVYMVNQAASDWLRDIGGEVTVQIEPRDGVDTERTVRDVAAFLGRQAGIRAVKPLSLEESSSLVEPWLGKSDVLKSLPVPRLIALEIDRVAAPNLEALRALLATEFKTATLDDHRYWQQQIRTVTRSLALGGLAILMLVGAATTAIIISATRSSMASNREIIEVLHLVGATDRYIAQEFDRHFLSLGVRAGLVGAVLAMLVFMLMPSAMELLGGNVVTMAEIRRLFGAGVLDLAGYGVLVVVVVVIAALCMLTSRFGVYHILNQQR